jgi:DNA repair exonuclease SbcCD ATPase subunit
MSIKKKLKKLRSEIMDIFDERLAELAEDLSDPTPVVSEEIQGLPNRVVDLEARLDNIDDLNLKNRVTKLESQIYQIQQEIQQAKPIIARLQSINLVEREEALHSKILGLNDAFLRDFNSLTERIRSLEHALAHSKPAEPIQVYDSLQIDPEEFM